MDTEAIKRRLLTRRDELRSREAHANAGLRQQPNLCGDYGDVSNRTEEDGLLSALSLTADAELKRIERALQRLRLGHYGTCAVCGDEIGPERLNAVPYADRCVSCA